MDSQPQNECKMYPTKSGKTLSSNEMAEALKEAIELYNNQIKSTRDARKKKRLHDKVRNIKLFVAQHDDIKQYIK